jgi:hypothetical protein
METESASRRRMLHGRFFDEVIDFTYPRIKCKEEKVPARGIADSRFYLRSVRVRGGLIQKISIHVWECLLVVIDTL